VSAEEFNLARKQKTIDALNENPFLTIHKLAQKVGVSDSTM